MTDFLESTPERELAERGSFATCAVGESMRPMLRGGRDMVIIVSPTEKIKKYDVILFKDEGSRYVLHRVVKLNDGGFITRGDNTFFEEYVSEEDVLGILVKYNKDGVSYSVNSLKYKIYSRFRVLFYPLRKFYCRLMIKIRKFFKKRNK